MWDAVVHRYLHVPYRLHIYSDKQVSRPKATVLLLHGIGNSGKAAWRSVILKKRCLIPADGFYEWKKFMTDEKERKRPFYIHSKQEEIFSFAGVWEAWKDSENNIWKTYSIITTEPNKEMSSIHDRMPVILHPEDEASWLESSRVTRDSIEPLLRPLEDGALEMYKVSTDVNTVKNNDENLLVALDS